ncbi:MIF4G-domain-containing protein [Pluteus cervinus]|uniref:MIF4G-domain-containing protein n=1 Tax=Pluteus cervinus TaxID=181527 RepID=A0ACD3AXL3_9AGAR|nr:MIF4G-domain-containing protein [Pluteus cervinus]
MLGDEDEEGDSQEDSEEGEGDSEGDDDESEESEDEEWGGIDEPAIPGADVQESENTDSFVSAGAYVPPHLRKQATDLPLPEVDLKLKRQLKGLLNRMSEQNIASILDSTEEVYRNNRRHDVTSTITDLIIDGVASHSSLLDSFVVLHAAFVASLHKLIGIEFAAYFVQTVVALYEKHYSEVQVPVDSDPSDQEETHGKECSNLMVLLSELYNFQVISATLIYDLIRGLLNGDLTEFNVELLLKITRNSGHQLRQDDPSALKDIIQIVQSKVTALDSTISSRTKFMIETLSNLKNNKSKRNIAQNQGGEAVERMKKLLSGIGKKRHVLAHEPLRVTLDDLHAAETKGKWWLVGAAWAGDPLVEKATVNASSAKDPPAENALLVLAKKQGMNTEIRRSIFVVLMSSEDYVDACERLSQLNLTEVQQREIVRVLLHCCGNEKAYNPYYALVCQHLCRISHSYRITVQFCLWDFLRGLGENNVGGAEVIKNAKDDSVAFDVPTMSKSRWKNVARAYGWWIAKDSVSLSILKPLDFTVLKPTTRGFMHDLLLEVFINSQLSTPVLVITSIDFSALTTDRRSLEEIFIKAAKLENLAMGLVYFMTESFRKVGGDDEFVKFVKRAQSIARDTLRTGLDVIPAL